jgi:3-phenylpropionate/trans-cinnamate dioxygenase ferredoxin subunit
MAENQGYMPIIEENELQEGKMKLKRTQGKPVLFIKQKGQIYVIDDRCPHMACKLSNGSLDEDVVICPCHEWRFNLKTGEYEESASYKLKVYPFKVEDGKVWVKLEEDDL